MLEDGSRQGVEPEVRKCVSFVLFDFADAADPLKRCFVERQQKALQSLSSPSGGVATTDCAAQHQTRATRVAQIDK
jgi:hypothetical protein